MMTLQYLITQTTLKKENDNLGFEINDIFAHCSPNEVFYIIQTHESANLT